MSRIGKLPIAIPAGVQFAVKADTIEIKGPKGVLITPLHSSLNYDISDKEIVLTRKDESRLAKEQHGLRRTLLANAVIGVSTGFSKTLEVNGVGYKVALKDKAIELNVGFSNPVLVTLPKGVEVKVDGNKLTLMAIDKALLGETAARIRRIRPPEPYKGKGIKYETEVIRRKAGKTGKK